MFRTLDDRTHVFGQIDPADVATAKALGITTIINNRPDGEEPGQPSGAAIAAAARDAGLTYVAIPVDHSGFRPEQVTLMAEALAAADGPVLAWCRSGTRSTFLWALAEASRGRDGADIAARARAAGYDLSPIRGALGL